MVGLTMGLCLGLTGYIGQVHWARQVGSDEGFECHTDQGELVIDWCGMGTPIEYFLSAWRNCPWYGHRRVDHEGPTEGQSEAFYWIPRRAYYECLVKMTGLTLSNDPATWEAWFKAHPSLVWDEKQKRLMEIPKP